MASKQTKLTVSNRPGGKPMKSLPSSIDIDATTTVEDAKKLIAKAAGGVDYNRIGIYDASNKLLKDRKALLLKQQSVVDRTQILVKDLGAQMSWRTVFMIEYFGPILFHLLALVVRPYVYNNPLTSRLLRLGYVTKSNNSLSEAQIIALVMIVLHFVKRELETMYLHKFSAASMPAWMVFRNSTHYWITGGAALALFIYAPTANTAKPIDDDFTKAMVYGGVALYLIGESMNYYCHIVLSRLRSVGGTERGIPQGFSFNWVTSPNYVWEILAWVGIIMVTRSWATVHFILWGWKYMEGWAQGKESNYRAEFGSKYQAKKYPLTPGLAFKDPKKRRSEKKAA